MADFFPFDSGQGANVTEAQWSLMAKNWLGTGVIKGAINEFQVYADSSGMQCKVKSGNAWIQGHFFQVVTETVMPISAANPSNPRIDRVILRVDWTANIVSIAVLSGTPAASPTPPTLTQSSAKWEISLAQVYVGTNVSTIVAGNVTDERNFVKNANAIQSGWSNLSTLNGWVSFDLTLYDTKVFKDEFGVVHFIGGRIKNGVTANGTAIVNIPVGMRPLKNIIWNEGTIQFLLDSTGNITGYGLNASDTVVGNLSWRGEQ